MSLNKQITVSDVFNAISRQRWKALLTFVLLMAMVVAAFVLLPRKYGSEGRLFVQLGRTGTGLDPTPGGTSISIQDSRETDIRSVVELVRSRAVIEEVVDKIGPDKILKGPLDFLEQYVSFDFKMPTLPWNELEEEDSLAREQYEILRKREKAAKAIEDQLSVRSEKKTSVISIYCKANSPTLAQKIVKEIMASTKAKHVQVHAIESSTTFYKDNFAEKQNNLVQVEKKLKQFRNKNRWLSLAGARATQQAIIDKLELERIDAESNYLQSQEKLATLNRQMTGIEPIVLVPTTGVEKLSTEDSKTELWKLESELRVQENTLHPDHPKLKQLKSAVKSLKSEIEQMPKARTESESQVNPVFEKVKVAIVQANADNLAFEKRLEYLNKKFLKAESRLEELNELDLESSQLQRDLQIAYQEMEIYIRKRTESSVIEDLNKKSVSDIVVAQKANLVVKHVSPKGSVFFPLGGMLAVLCSIGTALYFEKDLLGGHLSEEELEQILEIPILVTLPTVSSHRQMVN